ncbi:MAG: YegP family protein [Candidatus Enteromonas sp.]
MSHSKLKNRMPFIVGFGLLAISFLSLMIGTLTKVVPWSGSGNGHRFGILDSLYALILAFAPKDGTYFDRGEAGTIGGIVGLSLIIAFVLAGVVLMVVSAKKKTKRVLTSFLFAFCGIYIGYLVCILCNGLVFDLYKTSALIFFIVVAVVGLVGYALLWCDLGKGFVKREKDEAEIADEEIMQMMEESVEDEEPSEEEQPAEEEKEQASEEQGEEVQEEPVASEGVGEEIALEEGEKEEDVSAPAKNYNGRYEVFPEAGFFKFRLKANNGQILLVSNSYKTQAGALRGIETLRKNVEVGTHRVVVDKKGRGQFRIFTANDARLVVAGEIYPDAVGATKALDSVLRFYASEKVLKLDEIPEEEIREWKADLGEVKPTSSGKIEMFLNEEKKYTARLRASNGETLFETVSYASKAGLNTGIASIKEKVANGNVSIICDKQGLYQFKVYSDNGMVLVLGQTYPSKDAALSAANSAANFLAGDPKTVDLTKVELTPEE